MIRLIVDSISDITQKEAAALQIEVLPLTVRFGREEYLDGVEIMPEEFYTRLATVTDLPKTSQLSPDSFLNAFERNLLGGDEVICITGSSKLSGTYQSAVMARKMTSAPERVHLVDSQNGSLGESQLVWQAIAMRNAGAGAGFRIPFRLLCRVEIQALTFLMEEFERCGFQIKCVLPVVFCRLNRTDVRTVFPAVYFHLHLLHRTKQPRSSHL